MLLSEIDAALSPGSESLLRMPRKGLYAITPAQLSGSALIQSVSACLRGGAVMLQYRAKGKPEAMRHTEAQNLRYLTAEAGAQLIINDDLTLAQQLQCGVHLGESDASIAEARALLGPSAIVGASCYDSVVLAQRAAEAGASYVAFGAFFNTQSKATARRADIKLLRKAAYLGVPMVAIGGITPANAAPLIAEGADYLAVIGALFDEPAQTLTQAQRFTALFADSKVHPL